MQQRHALAIFIISWIGLLSLITWLDWHNVFFYLPYLPTVVFLLFPCLSLFALWKEEPSPKDRANLVTGLMWLTRVPLTSPTKGGPPTLVWIALVIGLAWLIGLPFIPSNPDKALLLQRNHIEIGMTEAQVRATMRDYRPGARHYSPPVSVDVEGLEFCTDDRWCETSVHVDFVAERVVRVWYDID